MPVGQKLPNGFGVFDVYGDVCGWWFDLYSEDNYSVSPVDNPHGPSFGSFRMLR